MLFLLEYEHGNAQFFRSVNMLKALGNTRKDTQNDSADAAMSTTSAALQCSQTRLSTKERMQKNRSECTEAGSQESQMQKNRCEYTEAGSP
jgi:hypothetical protein